jgi:NitT/TauT family transport system ATP-binding protein
VSRGAGRERLDTAGSVTPGGITDAARPDQGDGANGIAIDQVSMRFGTGAGALHAIDGITQTVDSGSFVSIVGPSGCGKSTLLSIVAGLQAPSSGTVTIGQRRVEGPDRAVGVVFQEDSTLPWKTVLENAAFGLSIAGVRREERLARAREMVELVGLQGFEHSYPAMLSGGMRQRVAIARALAMRPQVLLMDEPFGALDQQTRLIIGAELLRIWEQTGKTVLFVTHDIQESVLLSREVWVMSYRPGRILDVIPIDLPERRDASIVGTPRFSALAGRIWDAVRSEAMRGFQDEERGR